MIRVTKKALFAGNASHGGTPTKSSATKGDDAETPASGKKRATPGSGRGKKKGAVVAGEDDVEGERSPRKRAKKEKKGADVVKEEPKDEDEDGDGEMFGDVIFT